MKNAVADAVAVGAVRDALARKDHELLGAWLVLVTMRDGGQGGRCV